MTQGNQDSSQNSMQQLGSRMREARRARELSLTEMARRLGYTKSHLSSVENGVNRPSRELVEGYEREAQLQPGELTSIVGDLPATRHQSSAPTDTSTNQKTQPGGGVPVGQPTIFLSHRRSERAEVELSRQLIERLREMRRDTRYDQDNLGSALVTSEQLDNKPSPDRATIFVSHSHRDTEWCSSFVETLQREGADVFYDYQTLGAASFQQTLELAIITRRIFIVLVSPAASESPWVRMETQAAMHLQFKDPSRIVLPIMIAKTEMPLFWSTYQWVDASEFSPMAAAQSVMRLLERTAGITRTPHSQASAEDDSGRTD